LQEKKPSPLQTAHCKLPTGQEGFTLAALIVILTIIAIMIAYTVPKQWSLVMKRERDRHTIFLMKQFARGVHNWRTKHPGTLPGSLEQLQDARSPLMIRGGGDWPCPLTGKVEDWILVPPNAVTPPNAPVPPPGGGLGSPSQQTGAQNPTGTGSRLNKELSPKDYKGQFIGVRPNATGESFVALNGAENYDEWVYTADDLVNEINQRMAALNSR